MDQLLKEYKFPEDFMWGASTASHQVEGGTHNQWSVWELQVASEQAKTSQDRLGWLPEWKTIADQAQDPNNYISGRGVDHFSRYKEDFDILKSLNLNSFRFGVEWSRIEPEEGVFDQQAIDHYINYIAELKQRGITPMINLWHWTMPTWFTDKGGFSKRANIIFFERFVKTIAEPLISKCRYVITINEPNVYSGFSYLTGEWPPQEKNFAKFSLVMNNLAIAHNRVYKLLKKDFPDLQIGAAAQLANVVAKRPHNFIDQIFTQWIRYFWNWWYMNRIKKYQDFVGFNYYFTDYYSAYHKKNPKVPVNNLGWYMEPEGLFSLLERVWVHYKKPIIITENGLADMDDVHRSWWLDETMLAMEKALSEGINVIGYYHWSLLDNFEWAFGWWPKFGLVEVDRQQGMKRTVRASALRWAQQLQKIQKG